MNIKLLFLSLVLFSSNIGRAQAATVDVQVSLGGAAESVQRALDLKNKDAIHRLVYLFESPQLEMYNRSSQIRLRQEGKSYELSVKRWNLSAEEFDRYAKDPNVRCEQDVHGNSITLACGIKVNLDKATAHDLLAEKIEILSVLSTEQIALLSHTPGPLLILGPIDSHAWSWKGPTKKYSVDIQQITGLATAFMEFSVKVKGADPRALLQETLSELKGRGLEIPRDQDGRRLEKLQALLTLKSGA